MTTTTEGTIQEIRIMIGMKVGRKSLRTATAGMMIESLLGKNAPGMIQESRGLTIATGKQMKVSVQLRNLTGTTLEGQKLKSVVEGMKKESQKAGMVIVTMIETKTKRIAATNRERRIDAMTRKNRKTEDTQDKRQKGITAQIMGDMKVNLN